MNTAVANALNRVLGNWIKDLNADQLSLSVFKGKVKLENLHLKENIPHILGLPFDLKHGTIGRVKVSIPWTSLLSSSLTIEISDIYAYLTPKNPSSWSEKYELSVLEAAKESALQQYEAFTDNELKEATKTGFLTNSATTIVNNVQVKINNIYIRYEDTISSSDSFAIGLSLKSLSAQTCNKNWLAEYVDNSDIIYKFIKIEGFQLFCDYSSKIIRFQDFYKGPLETEFIKLAQQDIREEIPHNYLLKPFSFELKIILSIKPTYDIPLADISFTSSALFFEVFSGQIKIFLKLGEFMKLYNKFKAGVLKNLNEQDFLDDDIKDKYKNEYRYWKSCREGEDDKKKSENELKKMQEGVKIDSIRKARDEANLTLRHRKSVNLKIQEIQAIRNESRSLTSLISVVFSKEAARKAKKRAEEKKQRLEIAQKELKRIMDLDPKTLIDLRIDTPSSQDWQKYKFLFKINRGGFNICHDIPLLISRFDKFIIEGCMTDTSTFFMFNLSAFSIKDNFEKDKVYPYLFKSENFSVEFNQSFMDLKIASGDASLCVKYVELMKVVRVFSEAASTTVDVSEYLSQAGMKINNYIADGERYIAGVISKAVSKSHVSLDLELMSLQVVVPNENVGKKPYLVMNMNQVGCKTSIDNGFNTYKIRVSEMESHVFWNKDEGKDQKKKEKGLIGLGKDDGKNNGDEDVMPLSHVMIKKSKFVINAGLDGNLKADIIVKRFNVRDLRENAPFKEILSGYNKDFKSKENYQIKIAVDIQPKEHFREYLITVNELRFTANLDFASEMMNFYSSLLKKFELPTDHSSNQIVVSTERFLSKTSYSVSLNSLEIWFPTTENTSKVAQFNMAINLVYNTIYDISYSYSEKNTILSYTYHSCENEAYLTFSHMTGYLLSMKKRISQSKNKNLISPCRLSIEYTYKKNELDLCAETDLHVRIESICMTIGFKDLEFFKMLRENWTRRPKFVQNKPKDTENGVGKEQIAVTNINVDGDAVQVTLIDDTGRKTASLLHMQISNLLIVARQDPFGMSAKTEIIMFIDYFNKIIGAWEPVLEDWKFTTKYHFDYERNHSCISIKSSNTLNLNLTHNFIDNLSIISSKFFNPKKHDETEEFINCITEHTGIVYEIHNTLGIEITTWLRISQNKEKWLLNSNPIIFTQGYVNRLHALSRKKSKSCFALNNIQAPTKLAFYFGDENSKPNEVIIELVSSHVFHIQTYSEFPFLCLVEIYVQEGKRIISFKPGVLVSNNSSFKIGLKNRDKEFYLFPFTCQALPLEWTLSLDTVSVEGKKKSNPNEKLLLTDQSQFFIDDNPLVNSVFWYKIDSELKLQVIEINPVFFVKNLLHKRIEVLSDNEGVIESIEPGEEKALNIKPDEKYYMRIFPRRIFDCMSLNTSDSKYVEGTTIQIPDHNERGEMITESVVLYSGTSIKCKIIGQEESSISIVSEEKKFENNSHLAKYQKTSNKSSGSWVIKVYSEYIIVNKTQYDLILSGLEVPANDNSYYSSQSNKAQVKMKTFPSKYSQKITLDTIGVSGSVKITQTQDSRPQHFLFGYSVSQAPNPYILSKIITFAPRFILWNYLEIPLSIKQHNAKNPSIIYIKEHSSNDFSVQYHFDDYHVSKGLIVADASLINDPLDSIGTESYPNGRPENSSSQKYIQIERKAKSENTWSGPFNIEVIEDLQIKFYSRETPAEKKQNVFQKGFHVPKNFTFLRYVRVFIYSQDEATIHIAFLDPKDPDFRILNQTDEDIFIKQKSTRNPQQLIKKDSSLNWVWDNNLLKSKMVELSLGRLSKYLSLEKVQENNILPFGIYESILTVNGVTRELIIRSPQEIPKPNEESNKENNKIQDINQGKITLATEDQGLGAEIIDYTAQGKAKKFGTIQDFSKAVAMKMQMISSDPTKDIQTEEKKETAGFLKILQHIVSFEYRTDLKNIGISINDKANNELFYINLKNLKIRYINKATSFGVNVKTETQTSIRLEHLQIDYMGSDDKLIPVILYPVRHENDGTGGKKPQIAMTVETDNMDYKEIYTKADEVYYFFSLEMSRESSSKVKRDGTIFASMDKFDNIEILLREVQIRINEETIHNLLKVKNFFNVFRNTQQIIGAEDCGLVFSCSLPVIPFEPFSFQRKAYFNKVVIHAMKLLLTFKKAGETHKHEMTAEFPLITLIKQLGGAFVNVSESPMSFSKVHVENSFQTLDSFIWLLIKKYMQQGIRQFYKIFGSIDILGNPLGLIDSLGTGVYEFIRAPTKGFLSKTPGGFKKGLKVGVKALLSGVVGGSCESLSKISGSLYNVLRTATGEEVIYQELTTESIGKNIVLGLKDSIMDIAHGLGEVVIKPYQGARASGSKGFAKGIFLGGFCLISSPIKLILRVSNTFSTSIASTSILLTKGKIQKYHRTRFPRQFGIKNILEPYNKDLSEAQALLKTFIKNTDHKREKLIFYSQIKLEKDETILDDKNIILMITSSKLWVIIDGEIIENIKIDSIIFLEFHVLKGLYFLGFASEKRNFAIPSREYSKLYFVYNVLLSLNEKLPCILSHGFATPRYVNKDRL